MRPRVLPHVVFALLALAVIAPLGTSGYIFELDQTPYARDLWSFEVHVSQYGSNVPILFFRLLDAFLPGYIVQRIFLFTVIYLSGITAYLLVPPGDEIPRYYAGFLYAINPFTYIRIDAGQWGILLSYSLIPLATLLLKESFERGSIRRALLFSLVASLMAVDSHMLLLGLIVWTIAFLLYLARGSRVLKVGLAAAASFLLLNIYWICPAISSPGVISTVGLADLAVFAPRSDVPIQLALASMYGFWRPYITTKDVLPGWELLFVIILFLAVYGAASGWRDRRSGPLIKALSIAGILGFFLAMGIWFGPSAWILSRGIMRGMRDSHKFVALLALAYSYLGARGLREIPGGRYRVVLLLVPLIFSFTMFTGFCGQLVPTDFPRDWYEVRAYLDSKGHDYRILFLPWHGYMDFSWIKNRDKRIHTPAALFFNQRVVQASNVEIIGKYRELFTPDQAFVDYLIYHGNDVHRMGELLSLLNVRYVILAKEVDYKSYQFLFRQKDLKLVTETEHLYLLENLHPSFSVYQTSGLSYVSNPEELIRLSDKVDVTQRLYLFGSGKDSGPSGSEPLGHRWTGSGYELTERPTKRYIVVTEPFSKSWRYDERTPMPAYGFITAFRADGKGSAELQHDVLLPAVSAATLIFVLIYLSPVEISVEIHSRASDRGS